MCYCTLFCCYIWWKFGGGGGKWCRFLKIRNESTYSAAALQYLDFVSAICLYFSFVLVQLLYISFSIRNIELWNIFPHICFDVFKHFFYVLLLFISFSFHCSNNRQKNWAVNNFFFGYMLKVQQWKLEKGHIPLNSTLALCQLGYRWVSYYPFSN